MNTSVQTIPFNFNSTAVRVINREGQAWFVAKDAATALGYTHVPHALRMLDDDEKDVHIVDTHGGKQEMAIVNESGIYALVLKSRKPEAKPFRKWVTSEVLPSIRKTGSYTAPNIATPEQKQHIKQLVGKYCFENGVDYRVMWNTLFNECGFNKLDNLTPQAYEKALAYFGVDGRRHERSSPSVSINRMDVENLSAFFKTFELIQSDFHFLLQLGNLIDSPRLVSLWSKIDHANFIYGASELALGRIKAQLPRLN